jgi:hypothetical protein
MPVALQIRRELAAAMRNVGKLVGNTTMLAYVTQSVQTHHQEVMDILNKTGGCDAQQCSSAAPCSTSAARHLLPAGQMLHPCRSSQQQAVI